MRQKFLKVLEPEAAEVCEQFNKVLGIARQHQRTLADLRLACQRYTTASLVYASKLAAMEQFLAVVNSL
jgi:hypothetical protein